jgi:hypothetical protein
MKTLTLMNPYRAFQRAKARFDTLPVISFSRPSSVTRRGDEIIARWGLSVPTAAIMNDWYLKEEFVSLIESLIPEAEITSVRFDRTTRDVRVRFRVVEDDFIEWLRALPPDPSSLLYRDARSSVVRDDITDDDEFDAFVHRLLD